MEHSLRQLQRRARELREADRAKRLPSEVLALLQDLETLKEPEIDFKEIVDSIDESIFIADKDGYVLYVNPSYSKNTDVPECDVLHHNVRDIIADGVFTGGATVPVLQSRKKVYRLSHHLPLRPAAGWATRWVCPFSMRSGT